MLADPAIDAIVSCGPAPLHADHAIAALNASKPVLAIKPMGQTLAQARELEALTLSGPPPLLLEVEAFADAKAGARAFPVPMEDALHGIAVLDAMDRSVRSGGAVGV